MREEEYTKWIKEGVRKKAIEEEKRCVPWQYGPGS